MKPSSKISDAFRDKVQRLGEEDTVRAVVALDADIPSRTARWSRLNKDERRAEVEEATRDVITEFEQCVVDVGGQVLSAQPLLHLVTVQGRRALIEWLTQDDRVKAVLEDQDISPLIK